MPNTEKTEFYRTLVNNLAHDYMCSLLQNASVPVASNELPLLAVRHAIQLCEICTTLPHPDDRVTVQAQLN